MENTLFTFISLYLSHLLLIRIVYPKWLNDLFVVVVVAFCPTPTLAADLHNPGNVGKLFARTNANDLFIRRKKKKNYTFPSFIVGPKRSETIRLCLVSNKSAQLEMKTHKTFEFFSLSEWFFRFGFLPKYDRYS